MRVFDTYEATWYLMNGASIVSVAARKVASKKARHGIGYQWIIQMDAVSPEWVKQWREGRATGNLKDYANKRLKLKDRVKDFLQMEYGPR